MDRHGARALNNKMKADRLQAKQAMLQEEARLQLEQQGFKAHLVELITYDIESDSKAINTYVHELKSIKSYDLFINSSITAKREDFTNTVESITKQAAEVKYLVTKHKQKFKEFIQELALYISSNEVDSSVEELEEAKQSLISISAKWFLDYSILKKWADTNSDKEILLSQQHTDISNQTNVVEVLQTTTSEITPLTQISLPELKKNICDDSVKPLKQLLNEVVVTQNSDSALHNTLLNKYRKQYDDISNYYKQWQDKTVDDIYSWAISIKKNGTEIHADILLETIAIMDRAHVLVTGGYRLRDTQILSILAFIDTDSDTGKICQIQTGEGKTTIVSLLAVIKALGGGSVDIITSNNVLATDGVESKQDFYKIFGLSVAVNNPETTNSTDGNRKNLNTERACYKADIVYGSIGSFQFDYLKDDFLGQHTLAGRKCDTVILDEVDSMLVDNGRHIAKLANTFPGMESLRYVYIKIWQEVNKYKDKSYLKHAAIESTIQNELELLLPKHLTAYAKKQLDKWIDSAWCAKNEYHENQHYVIKTKDNENVITPVDYVNTGISMNNTVWPNGLHQFLQLKHNLRLTTETLTAAHISNMHYIKKYGTNIFGMTGTLGSQAEKELLSEIYNVDCAIIPTYKDKKFEELEGQIVADNKWLDTMIISILEQIDQARAVLVICETINEVRKIKQALELYNSLDKSNQNKISIYVDESEASITQQAVNIGDIIIATNISGRGTNLETTIALNAKGGLHVCVGFLPSNARVEEQAFGRTSRQGNAGSAELIIRESDIRKLGIDKPLDSLFMQEVKETRDIIESTRIEYVKSTVAELDIQDALFNHFTELYKEMIKVHTKTEASYFVFEDLKEFWAFWLDEQEKITLDSIDIKDKTNYLTQINEKSKTMFEQFKQKIEKLLDFTNGQEADSTENHPEATADVTNRIMHNPSYSVKQAYYFLQRNNDLRNDKLLQAQKALKHAIALTEAGSKLVSPYIGLFEIEIAKSWNLMKKIKPIINEFLFKGQYEIGDPLTTQEYDTIAEAQKYLKNAQKSLQVEREYLSSLLKNTEFIRILLPESSKESSQIMKSRTQLKALMTKAENKFSLVGKYDWQQVKDIQQLQEILSESIRNRQNTDNNTIYIHYDDEKDVNLEIKITNLGGTLSISYYDDKNEQTPKIPYTIKWLLTKYCYIHQKLLDRDASVLMPNKNNTTNIEISDLETQETNKAIHNDAVLNKNLLLKHLYARQICLNIQQDNITQLITKIANLEEDQCIMQHKSYKYLKEIDPKQEIITYHETNELENIWLGNIYGIGELQYRDDGLAKVKHQISESLSLLQNIEDLSQLPILANAIKQTAYILIAESICELISEITNNVSPNKLSYIKTCVISNNIELTDDKPLDIPKILATMLDDSIKHAQAIIPPNNLNLTAEESGIMILDPEKSIVASILEQLQVKPCYEYMQSDAISIPSDDSFEILQENDIQLIGDTW